MPTIHSIHAYTVCDIVEQSTPLQILQVFVLMTSSLFHPNFWGVPVAPDRPRWGQPEHEP